MKNGLAFAALALGACLALSACAKHDDASNSSSDASSSTTAITTDASPAAVTTDAPSRATESGSGSDTNLSDLGVPIYTNTTSKATNLDVAVNGQRTRIVALTTTDSFDAVDKWYKSHLDSGYADTHHSANGFSMATYVNGSPSDAPFHSVMLNTGTDSSTAGTITITITVKTKV